MVFPRDFVPQLEHKVSALRKQRAVEHSLQQERQEQYDLLKSTTQINQNLVKHISQTDAQVLDLVSRMLRAGCLTDEQREEIVGELVKLKAMLEHADVRGHDIEYLLARLSDELEHFESYLGYEPGTPSKRYVRLVDLFASPERKLVVDKAFLELRDSHLFYEGRRVQGFALSGDSVVLTADHYSSSEAIRDIVNHQRMVCAASRFLGVVGGDRYVYLAEVGTLRGLSPDSRSQFLGLGGAKGDSFVNVQLRVADDLLWVRPQRGYPVKFAIAAKEVELGSSGVKNAWVQGRRVA